MLPRGTPRQCANSDYLSRRPEHRVGPGTDLDGGYGTEQVPVDLNSIADLQQLPALLRQRGYSEPDVEGIMWRNFVGFLGRVLG
jgi:microsomal dipeptidase-like Zn-dependent dipeptidase